SRKKTLANSVDPDETLHDAASHQGLRCLLIGISEVYEEEDNALFMSKDPTDRPILAGYLINSPAVYLNLARIYMVLATKPGSGKTGLNPFSAGNRILKAFANSLDPDEMPQNVAQRGTNIIRGYASARLLVRGGRIVCSHGVALGIDPRNDAESVLTSRT
ncbi:hypothetical protein DPMN_022852, partial [Dreissena polymorpha]